VKSPDVIYARGLIRDLTQLDKESTTFTSYEREQLLEELKLETSRFQKYIKRKDTDASTRALSCILRWYETHFAQRS